MATGRIGVTPTLGVRWSKAPAGGTTSLSGLDDNSVSLVYSVGYEQVYRNGVLLSRGNDYTATNGTSITLIDATITGDIIEVFANELVPLTDAISKGQFTAKGSLLSASAASTPGVLAVGSNDQVLTADSTTTTGLKWATPASGGMTLLSTTTLSGATTTISGISGSYTDLFIVVNDVVCSGTFEFRVKINSATNKIYGTVSNLSSGGSGGTNMGGTEQLKLSGSGAANDVFVGSLYITQYASTTYKKTFIGSFVNFDSPSYVNNLSGATFWDTAAISSLTFSPNTGTFSSGTVLIYGVK